MEKERIVIPTRGRVGNQLTYDILKWNESDMLRYAVTLVCSEEEISKHRKKGYWAVASPTEGITNKRQWIMEWAKRIGVKRIIMLDDDLNKWAIRKSDKSYHLRDMKPEEIWRTLEEIFRILREEDYPLVGVSQRSGNNRLFPKEFVACTRQLNVHGIDVRVYHKIGAVFNRLQLMEDFDVTLQFLEAGYKNMVLTDCTVDQMIGKPGGCSTYRTARLQEQCAKGLAQLHPDFVTVVAKANKTGWEGMKERFDVRIQWKKAYESSKDLT